MKTKGKMKRLLQQGIAMATAMMLCVISASATINVTFVNEPVKEPDLFITKTVVPAVEGYAVPDDTFTFFIKVNGTAYKNEYYFLSTNGGPYEEYDATGTAYQTDRYGRFYLQDGQTAKFPYIGQTATYEVSEEEAEGYIVHPASGKISGTMQGMAAAIEFENVYVPNIDIPGEETDFRVYKNVIFPDGLHAMEGPDFTFELTLDGEVFAGEQYSVYDTDTEMLVRTDFTDANGQFTLKGDQYAVFEGVLSSMDYKVEEILPSGSTWHTVGSAVQQGATTYPMTRVDFTNVEASLAVEKVMQDNEPADGQMFTFTLTNEASKNMANVPYYLYSRSGYPVDEEIHQTRENGQFDLEADQIAVFLGITDKKVNMKEEPVSGYELVSPGTAGYKDIEISDYPGTYRFTNKTSVQKGALTVIKTVKNATELAAPEADTFTFGLSQSNGDGAYGPVVNALYKIVDGENEYSYKTDEFGFFSLKANQRAVFEFLEVGVDYRVTEIMTGLSKAYSCMSENMAETATLTSEGETLIFSNMYSPNLTLNIKKVDFLDNTLALEGVGFELYSDKKLTNLYASGVTDADGNITFGHLADGTWYLVESNTIDDYILPVRPFVLEIDDKYKYPDETMTATISGGDVLSIDGNTINVQIENSTNILWTAILPLTGGEGTYAMTMTGMALVLTAGGILVWRKRKEGEIA